MNVDRDRNMALKPSYNAKLYLPGLSNTEILILALEASQKLEWNIEEVTPEGIVLKEYNPEFTVEEIQAATEAKLIIADDLKPIEA